jgi:AcrR family transcriptional regulator
VNTELSGTKERIFDISIQLIAKDGFESVSIRQIAEGVGINAASIYYYFSSKEEILDTIYQYFREHWTDNRKGTGQIQTIIETGSAIEVITALWDTAFLLEEKLAVRIILISKIILMRINNDSKAKDFFLHEWFDTDVKYLQKWLGYAAEIGRLEKSFDIDTFSTFFWRQLIMMGIWAFADPNYEVRKLDEETTLLNWFAEKLPLKQPLQRI